ncbi:hypothetical protein BLL37_02145 [Pseudomonas azotoformans]|uniref:DUF6933 domain-containing protein n=1 Tax=Pseudomonas azotoformans TaxID=47878 RepID=A0A1V2JSS0_PSEAZ|nr:hypothetical protein [Pseudomonas azotoformans]OIN44462.1 hypothetical protein BFL39_27950 [Pseudomonas azotoformans]ONH48185.1 hypothetical protein BLL37_02145 [Pseudomonas azotoformans]SDN83267.1 hypothetical protein SAMN04489799_2965 [Pseudomonas azotoformans]
MLTFNCSQAACEFFSRVHKGKKHTPVLRPALPVESYDLHSDPHQWLVHAATVKRKHVIVVMHLKTRYCMLFFDMKKADSERFFQVFFERWTAGILDNALKCAVLDWVDPQLLEQMLANQAYCLVQRGDRSGQTTLNEVLRFFKWDAEDFDFVTQPWSPLRYDAGINRTPRGFKGQNAYVFPDEEMLIHWLVAFGGVGVAKAQQTREIYRAYKASCR